RTNVLILSLFFSVGLAVLYYVAQIILDVMASTGKIPPVIGAWLTFFIFLPIAFYLISKAKT
ncbi:MAG TPA: LptF/LptG family permease, partial [Spirochaetota bacterium]|nr:LptF/LptG family permease [Spirochaetota bacterium]